MVQRHQHAGSPQTGQQVDLEHADHLDPLIDPDVMYDADLVPAPVEHLHPARIGILLADRPLRLQFAHRLQQQLALFRQHRLVLPLHPCARADPREQWVAHRGQRRAGKGVERLGVHIAGFVVVRRRRDAALVQQIRLRFLRR